MWAVAGYGPLFIAAFVLGIIAMLLKRIRGGFILLLASALIPFLLIITYRYVEM